MPIPRAIQRLEQSQYWNTLGVALYRNGDWRDAVAALKNSMELNSGGETLNGFFLAMACWRLGQRDEARTWYDKSVVWMEKNDSRNPDLVRFRAEAAAWLGLANLPADVFARQ